MHRMTMIFFLDILLDFFQQQFVIIIIQWLYTFCHNYTYVISIFLKLNMIDNYSISFKNMFIDFLERGRKKEKYWLRNIDRLPPVHTLTGEGARTLGMFLTRNPTGGLVVYGTMLQPIEPHLPGQSFHIFLAYSYKIQIILKYGRVLFFFTFSLHKMWNRSRANLKCSTTTW